MEAAISPDDSIITAYRCHGWTYTRGRTVKDVLCELAGRITSNNNFKNVVLYCIGSQKKSCLTFGFLTEPL